MYVYIGRNIVKFVKSTSISVYTANKMAAIGGALFSISGNIINVTEKTTNI